MTTIQQQHVGTLHERENTFFTELAAGSTSEALGGAAAIVLAILGLAGVQTTYMLPIAALVIGAAFVIEGGVLIARYAEAMAEMPANRASMQLGGSVSTEFLAGCAGIVLGVLALVGIAPQALVSVSVLVFGAALLWGSGSASRLQSFEFSTTHPMGHEVAREAMVAASGAQAFIGLATVVLGILALTHIATVALTLVAMLIVGAAIVLTGSSVTGWFMSGTSRMH